MLISRLRKPWHLIPHRLWLWLSTPTVCPHLPPAPPNTFIAELTELLTFVCSKASSTLLLGDFKIHVDSSSCSFAAGFLSVLDCFNISQHVLCPIYVKGHTLDLVCSTGTLPSHLQCLDLAVSVQHAVLFNIPDLLVAHMAWVPPGLWPPLNTCLCLSLIPTHPLVHL